MCTLLPAHHKSSPHPHHPADPLHPFALPHLPFKRLFFLNLESLHLSYFSYIWKEGQEDFVSYVFPRSEVQCLWTKLPCERAFSSWTEEPEKLCYVPARHLCSLFTAPGSGSPGTLCCLSVLLSAYRTDSINGAVSFSVSLQEFG